MPYAEGRTFYDADRHLMELHDWLASYADPGVRERIRPLHLGGAGRLAEKAVAEAEARRGDPEAARALEENVMKAKGWSALGAFDPAERSRALDLPRPASESVHEHLSMPETPERATERFYHGNFAAMTGL